MQSVTSAFTAEEKDSVRKVAWNLQVSWKKQTTLGNQTFTIGVSTIGGTGVIGINPGAIGSPGNYLYSDESSYLLEAGWERGLNIPLGGLSKAAGEAVLDNTTDRFTPDYMGGSGELYTAAGLPRRPFIINAGLNVEGVDITLPQFAGITKNMPRVNDRTKQFTIDGFDYVDFFSNRFVDQTVMFTGQSTDQILTRLLQDQGLSTAQYDLDTGLNEIPFAYFEKGDKMAQVVHELVEAENGHFFQDEEGKFRFWNRQHWTLPPYTTVQRVIHTSQVIESEAPDSQHLINVVEVKSERYGKQPSEIIFKLASPVEITAGEDFEIFVNFDNPVIELETVDQFLANVEEDGSGSDITSSVSVHSVSTFTTAAKIVFTTSNSGYLTELTLYGRTAKPISDIYIRDKDDSSVTAYEERPVVIDNRYIQDQTWAESLSRLLLNQYSEPDRLQKITVRAIPELQFGDLISWRGMDWRIYGVKAKLDRSEGFVQELLISQAESSTVSYFTIGVSTIGSTDIIAA